MLPERTELLTMNDVTAILGVSIRTVRNLYAAGKMPPRRLLPAAGPKQPARWLRSDIMDFLDRLQIEEPASSGGRRRQGSAGAGNPPKPPK